MLKKQYPRQKTGFMLMRTNCEAPFMTTMFSELPVLFTTYDTTTLPPTLAVYLMVNALHQHGLTPEVFVRLCHDERPPPGLFGSPFGPPLAHLRPTFGQSDALPQLGDVRTLLNTVRDILCGWTACRYEVSVALFSGLSLAGCSSPTAAQGRYEPDTCLGKDSDHQPFKNTCKPGRFVAFCRVLSLLR